MTEHKAAATAKEAPIDIDFAALYHDATVAVAKWPPQLEKWAEEHPRNAHLLAALKSAGQRFPSTDAVLFRLIDEVLKAVEG